jgi:hypothetical protein
MLGHLLSRTRGDFRILAHEVFRKAEELDGVILPISFEETREATEVNVATRKAALEHLRRAAASASSRAGRSLRRCGRSAGRWTRAGGASPRG